MPFTKRLGKGSIATWLLLLAVFALAFVGSIIALEMLVKWVTLTRIKNAAQEAVVVYARDLVKLRDNQLSFQNKKELTFTESGVKCTSNDDSGCTPLKTSVKTKVAGAKNLEYLNASQVFLYNIYGSRLADPTLVDNVEQHQCHTSWDSTRFKKNPLSPVITDCAGNALGKISSPIMDLTWNFDAQEYGQGTCCPSGSAQDGQKDFCVTMVVRGRLDPRMSGGLPFIQAVDFIKVGDFNMVLRSVGDKMSVKESTGDDIASNLSAESVSIEEQPKACIPAAPVPIPTPPALSTPTPTPPALSTPTPSPTPPVFTPIPTPPSTPPPLPSPSPTLPPSSPTPIPTLPPVGPGTCNQTCIRDSDCGGGLICFDDTPPTPTLIPTPVPIPSPTPPPSPRPTPPPSPTPTPSLDDFPCFDENGKPIGINILMYDKHTVHVPGDGRYFNKDELFNLLVKNGYNGFPTNSGQLAIQYMNQGLLKVIPKDPITNLPILGRNPDPAIEGVDFQLN